MPKTNSCLVFLDNGSSSKQLKNGKGRRGCVAPRFDLPRIVSVVDQPALEIPVSAVILIPVGINLKSLATRACSSDG